MTNPLIVADIGMIHPCSLFEHGSWEWWFAGCWLPFSVADVGFALILVWGAVVLARHFKVEAQA